jgi:hypothetical protein
MKACGGVDVQFHVLLTLPLAEDIMFVPVILSDLKWGLLFNEMRSDYYCSFPL